MFRNRICRPVRLEAFAHAGHGRKRITRHTLTRTKRTRLVKESCSILFKGFPQLVANKYGTVRVSLERKRRRKVLMHLNNDVFRQVTRKVDGTRDVRTHSLAHPI